VILSRYLETRTPEPLADLLLKVVDACTGISDLVRAGAANEIFGELATENVQGETQKKLDVISNDLLLDACAEARALAAMASEELDSIHPVRSIRPDHPYLLLFDPLDGSSNIDINAPIGTIFSVLRAPSPERERAALESDFLQSGRAQLAAGYVIYGPQTTLVLTVGQGVAMFTLDPAGREWMQTRAELALPRETQEFAINASNARHWDTPVSRYIEDCLAGKTGPLGKNYNMRWVGSMVGDVHRIMIRGGVFLYPWDRREPDRPGKLRQLYEANPMAMIVEQAGGLAFDGLGPTLDAPVTALHQRAAVMLGSAAEVERLQALHGAPATGGRAAGA